MPRCSAEVLRARGDALGCRPDDAMRPVNLNLETLRKHYVFINSFQTRCASTEDSYFSAVPSNACSIVGGMGL
jgi:hypothetical protein